MAEDPSKTSSEVVPQDPRIPHEIITQGKLCALARMRDEYLPQHIQFLNDPEVHRYIRTRPPFDIEHQRAWIVGKEAAGEKIYALLMPDEQGKLTYIGMMSFMNFTDDRKSAESASFIGDKRYWMFGIAREARFLQLKIAFEDLGLDAVTSITIAPNARSQRLLESTGYELVQTVPDARTLDGVQYDELRYRVTPEKWRVAYAKYLEDQQKR
jgi:RimJ/RimL family protein N-acetyltransferase